MAKVIIGIHGLSKKPERSQLQEWWLKSINDGLKAAGARQISEAEFDMAYWADLRYQEYATKQRYNGPDTDRPGDDPNAFVLSLRNAFTGVIGRLARRIDSIRDEGKIDELKNALRKTPIRKSKIAQRITRGPPCVFERSARRSCCQVEGLR